MQLTIYSDYALRTLMYLGANGGRPVPVTEIAAAYQVSLHHVAKVAKALVRGGFVRAHRGRSGGIELMKPPREVTVGSIVRYTEPTLNLLECFDRATSTCPLTGACRLERTLHEARSAFLGILDRTTLADLLSGTPALTSRLPRRVPGKRGVTPKGTGARRARANRGRP